MTDPARGEAGRPTRVGGLLLGVGFGGFVDGILLHQILQWHHMLSAVPGAPVSTVRGLRLNTLADGLFHAGAWVALLVGSLLVVRAWRGRRLPPTWRAHSGLLLAGWGAFNLVEGVVDHEILGIHHVRDDIGGPLSWDLAFLAVSALLLATGWALYRNGCRRSAPAAP